MESRLSLKGVILLPSRLFPREWGQTRAQTGEQAVCFSERSPGSLQNVAFFHTSRVNDTHHTIQG